jgi:tetratricopeptide (TPR) repeat protein
MVAITAALLFFQAAGPAAEGLKALEEARYAAAAEAFTRAVQADPSDYYAHFNLALAYSFLQKDNEAIAEYRKTLELKPNLYQAQLNEGILLIRQKHPAEALPLLAGAVEQKPNEFRPRFYVAQAQLATGSLAEAAQSFEAATAADPKSADAQLGWAQALAREGKLADAAPHFREAGRMDEHLRDSILELAELYEKAGQKEQAIAIYKEFPDNPGVQERLGALLLETGQSADAIPRLEAAYTKQPSLENSIALAEAYLFSHQPDKALPLLDKAVASQPANYDLRLMYGRALRDSKRFSPAAAQFYEGVKLKPDARATWNDLGDMLYMSGNLEQALAAFDRAHQLGDDSAGNWFLRAIILDKLMQKQPALEAYERFLALSQGKSPDQEFQARQRARIIKRELEKR